MEDAKDVAGRPSYDELAALVVQLRAEIVQLRAEVVELKARLAASSRNSSKPPSLDGLSKPPVDPDKNKKGRSLRKRSGKKRGGQEGHEGARLDRVAVPDRSVEHPPERCEECGKDLAGAESVAGGESRQVFDVPEQRA